MPSPPTVDVEALLAPIPGDNPAGRPLVYEPEYDQIREARRADDESFAQDAVWKRELKAADWDLVVSLGTGCLAGKTKDLQIAAWLTEALVRLHGFAGLRDGLLVTLGIQQRYWDTYYPVVEDGDLETRHGPFVFLNHPTRGLPFLVRSTPLTRGLDGGDYTYFQYLESRETDNLIKKEPAKEKEILARGRVASKQFDAAVAATPGAFYVQLVDDLKQARDAFHAFEADTDARFGADAPSLLKVGEAIDECLAVTAPVLAAKRLADPGLAPEPAAGPAAVVVPPDADGAPGPSPDPAARPADGAAAPGGVAVPRRRTHLGTPQEADAPDFGRVLIDFRDRARALAEAGAALAENRKKYADLLAELKRLDEEYEALSAVVGRDHEAYQLLARLLSGRG